MSALSSSSLSISSLLNSSRSSSLSSMYISSDCSCSRSWTTRSASLVHVSFTAFGLFYMHSLDHSYSLFSCTSKCVWYIQFHICSQQGRSREMPSIFQYFQRLPRLPVAFHSPSSIRTLIVLYEYTIYIHGRDACNIHIHVCIRTCACMLSVLVYLPTRLRILTSSCVHP